MKCSYEHHEKAPVADREDMGKCPTHDEEYRCGPFHHMICPKCTPYVMRKCGMCRKAIIDCYC